MPWEPTSVLVEDWGRIQILINGQDVTFWRGKPVEVLGYSSNEPFGDSIARIRVPQISVFELPPWLVAWADVDLLLNRPDGSGKVLWEGLVASWECGLDGEADSFVLECIGALYQADFFLKQPVFDETPIDIGMAIYDELETRVSSYGLRLSYPNRVWTGIPTVNRGSWNALVTGYFQDLLANATTSVVFNGSGDLAEFARGITVLPDGRGYWLTGSRGSVVSFGRTEYFGSAYSIELNKPSTGMATDGNGYWIVGEDGGVFAFGVPFHGSLGGITHPWPVLEIEYDPYSGGYWLCDDQGHIYAFGGARYLGGAPSLPTGWKIVDFTATADGGGYWMVSNTGAVYAFGNATYQGGGSTTGKVFAAIAGRPQNDGYWLGATDGSIFGYGNAFGVLQNPTVPVTGELSDMKTWPGGEGLLVLGTDGGVFAYGTARFFGSLPGGQGNVHQWTLTNLPGRRPEILVKNRWTEHWSMRVGTPGMVHNLSRDYSVAPNVVLGEGIDHDNCRWRNSKYPNLRPDTAPVWPGRYLDVGMTGADVRSWEQEMYDSGWRDVSVNGSYSQGDKNVCRQFQIRAGLQVDGVVGPQTWAATFRTGSNAGDLSGAHFAPLAILPSVEPFTYDARGAATGSNPEYVRGAIRVERFVSYGDNVEKHEAMLSAQRELARDGDPGWTGSFTLTTDPVEGSRFEIKAGQNLVYRGHRGEDRIFHIASAEIDLEGLSVSLTVDTHARDMLTLEGARSRDRENLDPARRQKATLRNSKVVEDRRAVWDCENGAGIVPYHAVQAGLWNVLRIPAGEVGTIVRSYFKVTPKQEFSVAVFDRPTTHSHLQRFFEGRGATPLTVGSTNENPWDEYELDVPEEQRSLIIAWGGPDHAAGYSPRPQAQDAELTGVLLDDDTFTYRSAFPPWLWVGIWTPGPERVIYAEGKFTSGVLD